MNNWDKYRRMQCNIDKAILNEAVIALTMKHHKQLWDLLVHSPEDKDIFNDTYLKLTYKYDPDKDFVEQFKWVFNQLKGAYKRDAKCNIHYQIDESRLDIPEYLKDEEAVPDKGTDIVTKLKAILSV